MQICLTRRLSGSPRSQRPRAAGAAISLVWRSHWGTLARRLDRGTFLSTRRSISTQSNGCVRAWQSRGTMVFLYMLFHKARSDGLYRHMAARLDSITTTRFVTTSRMFLTTSSMTSRKPTLCGPTPEGGPPAPAHIATACASHAHLSLSVASYSSVSCGTPRDPADIRAAVPGINCRCVGALSTGNEDQLSAACWLASLRAARRI